MTRASSGTPSQSREIDLRHEERLLGQKEAAYILGISPRSLEAWRCKGGGPKFIRYSNRCIRYRRTDLEDWLQLRIKSSTSEV